MDPTIISRLTTGTEPIICLEVNPPRGVNLLPIFERLDNNLEGVDFLNVTDSALARMKCGALSFASVLKQRYGLDALVNLSCRDRNVIALQGELLAGWMLGIRSVIALTGDAVTIGDMPEAKGVFEINSIGLLKILAQLNSGLDMAGNKLSGAPDYVPGVVVNPNARNPSAEIKRLKRKVDAGAAYALSQPVFDEQNSVSFFKEAKEIGIPILMGLLPFKSAHSAQNLSQVPGIKMSEKILLEIENAGDKDLSDFSIEHCLHLAELNREYVRGFHVISGVAPKVGNSVSQSASNSGKVKLFWAKKVGRNACSIAGAVR